MLKLVDCHAELSWDHKVDLAGTINALQGLNDYKSLHTLARERKQLGQMDEARVF